MTNRAPANGLPLSLVIVFCLTTLIFLLGREQLLQKGVDTTVALIGNALLFAVSLGSFLLYRRAMLHPTTFGFLRNTYSGLFLKLLTCVIAIVIYVVLFKDKVNKPAIFVCVFLYFVYTLLEMRSLMQWNKARRNA